MRTLTEDPVMATRQIPGDPGLPLIGNTLGFMRNPNAFLEQRYRKYGEVSWTNSFGIKLVTLLGPDANQFVFRNQGDLFSNNQGWDYFIGKFFTRGIMLLDFDEHRYHRSIMQAAFKKPVLVRYLRHMNPMIDRGIGDWRPSGTFRIFEHIKALTLDMATEVFVGAKLGPEADTLNKAFIDTVKAGTALVRRPVPGLRWKKGLDGRKVLEDFFRASIPEKRARETDDLFSVLCHARAETGESFTDDDVVNHMIFLLMAAHDTTTSTLTTMFYALARHPEQHRGHQLHARAEPLRRGRHHRHGGRRPAARQGAARRPLDDGRGPAGGGRDRRAADGDAAGARPDAGAGGGEARRPLRGGGGRATRRADRGAGAEVRVAAADRARAVPRAEAGRELTG